MHLTVRMAWHDNNWNGKICADPEQNFYCVGTHSLLAKRIATNRNLEKETENKNRSVKEVQQDVQEEGYPYMVPCYWSVNAFSDQSVNITHWHPFTNIQNTINDTLRPYSVYTWPFKLSFVHNPEKKMIHGKHPPDLDKRIDNFIKKFPSYKSIIFFYANYDNPVSADDMQYLVLGCSVITQINDTGEFDITPAKLQQLENGNGMKNFSPMNWALQVTHDFEDFGILLPYKEYLQYVATHPKDEEKLHEMKVVVEESALISGFKYVAMDIDDDKCLYLLYKIRKSLLIIKDHGIVADQQKNNEQLEKIEFLIDSIWEKRTLYPALSKIFKYFELDEQYAREISESICKKSNLVETFDNLLQGNIPDNLQLSEPSNRLLLELATEQIFMRRVETLKTLALFNLTQNQIDKIIDNGLFNELAQNPYILYEKYVAGENDLDEPDLQDEGIDIFKIDIALIPDARFVIKDKKLQKIQADSPERLRAVIIDYLYRIGKNKGDCYDSIDNILEELREYPLFYRNNIRIDEEGIIALEDDYREHFEERLVIEEKTDHTFYYLEEVKFAENIIGKTFEIQSQKEFNSGSDADEYINSCAEIFEEQQNGTDIKQFIDERKELYSNIFYSGFYLLTGSAGSGKTYETVTIIETIVNELEEKVTILAPTGKATLRIAEKLNERDFQKNSTPKPETIHRFIYRNKFGRLMDGKDYTSLLKEIEEEKIPVDNLIIDESSMVDLFLMAVLFSIIRMDKLKRIILVGDEYQLPPIGFGKPFRDLIDYVKADEDLEDRCYIRLQSNCRQLGEDVLKLAEIYAADEDNDETILENIDQEDDFERTSLKVMKWSYMDELNELLLENLDDLLSVDNGTNEEKIIALNYAFGLYDSGHVPINNHQFSNTLHLNKIQFLSPYRAGYFGTLKINKTIQSEYRKKNDFKDSVFSYSEKIIRLKNWYKGGGVNRRLYLSNGSIGMATFHWNYGGHYRKYQYFFTEIEQAGERYNTFWDGQVDDKEDAFELAYAITVHKSQGSDFDNVFLVIPKRFGLLCKELIYTALTRAKQKLYLFVQKNQGQNLLEIAKNRSLVEHRKTSVFSVPSVNTDSTQLRFELNITDLFDERKLREFREKFKCNVILKVDDILSFNVTNDKYEQLYGGDYGEMEYDGISNKLYSLLLTILFLLESDNNIFEKKITEALDYVSDDNGTIKFNKINTMNIESKIEDDIIYLSEDYDIQIIPITNVCEIELLNGIDKFILKYDINYIDNYRNNFWYGYKRDFIHDYNVDVTDAKYKFLNQLSDYDLLYMEKNMYADRYRWSIYTNNQIKDTLLNDIYERDNNFKIVRYTPKVTNPSAIVWVEDEI